MDAAAIATLLAWGALKGALLLAAAGAATIALRDAPAAARHAIWAGALSAALILPLLDAFGPAWRLVILPAAPAADGAPTLAAGAEATRWFPLVMVGIWAVGVLAACARWIAAAIGARRLVARSRPFNDEAWRRDAIRLGYDLGLRRPATLRTGDSLVSPVAWGVRRPVLLLPAGAAEWSDERREAVLMHELAHVRRRDCLTGLIAEAACALHWFDPLAWIAYRRLHVERERACDDGVLRGGLLASRYATHLLAVARDVGRTRETREARLTPALARRTEIEERIRAMLDGRPRSGPMSRAALSTLSLFTIVAAGLLGAVEPVRRPAPAPIALNRVVEYSTRPVLAPQAMAAEGVAEAPTSPVEVRPVVARVRARRPAPPRAVEMPPAPMVPEPPDPMVAPRIEVALAPSVHSARVMSWQTPSGPMASDEPRRVARVVRVRVDPTGRRTIVVFPDFSAGDWGERTEDVRVVMERSFVRDIEVRAATAARAALGVHAERVVASAARHERGETCVDSASHEGYRAGRVEESPRGKRGT